MANIERNILKEQGRYKPYDFFKDEKQGLERFNIEHLKGIFYFYFILNGIAFIIAIIERLIQYPI
jgi:hypothetical protein